MDEDKPPRDQVVVRNLRPADQDALIAVDAPPASYLLNLGAASEIGIGLEDVQGVLTAIAPIVGTARVTAASGNIMGALGFAIEVAELEAELDAEDAEA